MSIIIALLNLFFLVVLLGNKKFRTLDFVCVMISCAVDVLSAGIMGCFQNWFLALAYLVPPCMYTLEDILASTLQIQQIPQYLIELALHIIYSFIFAENGKKL